MTNRLYEVDFDAQIPAPRGVAGLRHVPGPSDVIVDVCYPGLPVGVEETVLRTKPPRALKTGYASFSQTNELHGFLDYQLGIDVVPIDNVSVLQTLPTDAIGYEPRVLKVVQRPRSSGILPIAQAVWGRP